MRLIVKPMIFAALSLTLGPAMANPIVPDVLPPYTAVCIEESAERYFLGEEGRWRRERVPAQERVELDKLEPPGSAEAWASPDWAACTEARVTEIAPHIHFVEGCYAVREVGDKGEASKRLEMCSEYYHEGKIISVDCRVLSFQPNGRFQRQRWVADAQHKGQDAVLKTSGRCRMVKR